MSASFSCGPESKTAWTTRPIRRQIMGRKLYVGNLSYDVDCSTLQSLFEARGTVLGAEVLNYGDSGASKGLRFVEMDSDDAAQAATAALNGQQIGGRALPVNEANPRED